MQAIVMIGSWHWRLLLSVSVVLHVICTSACLFRSAGAVTSTPTRSTSTAWMRYQSSWHSVYTVYCTLASTWMHPWLWGFLKQPSRSLWMTPAAVWMHPQEQVLPAKQKPLLKAKTIWLFLLLSSWVDAVLIVLLSYMFLVFTWHLIAIGSIAPCIWYLVPSLRALVFQYGSSVWLHQRCAAIMSWLIMSWLYADLRDSVLFLFIIVVPVLCWNAWPCDVHVATALRWWHVSIWRSWNRPLSARYNKCACLHVEALTCRQCVLINVAVNFALLHCSAALIRSARNLPDQGFMNSNINTRLILLLPASDSGAGDKWRSWQGSLCCCLQNEADLYLLLASRQGHLLS